MNLRKLKQKDAQFMLEWMHNKDVVENLQIDFLQKTLHDCEKFIVDSQDVAANLHLAIVDDKDTYMGTVSLKNIVDGEAEFAITVRECAMGKGYSEYGMMEIFRKGLEELKLKRIYWCVSPDNKRALRFYDKNGCERVNIEQLDFRGGYTAQQRRSYIWYQKIR